MARKKKEQNNLTRNERDLCMSILSFPLFLIINVLLLSGIIVLSM